MATSRIPNALEMKRLKYGDRPDSEKDRMAEILREQGRRAEAILLFQGRPDHPFLEEEKHWAVERGAAFHLLNILRLGVDVTEDDFRVCGQAAERQGRWMDARQCYLAIDDPADIERIAENLPRSMRPEPAEGMEGAEEDEGSQ